MSTDSNSSKNKFSVSLVLGSGGARGMAHIGVIHWLEEHGFNIESISGSSIGALVGGTHAANKLDIFENWVRALDTVDIINLLDVSWHKGGFVKGDKIIATLTELIGDQQIENLPVKYTAVATDIKNEKEVWINNGPLFDAIRASISLPLFFSPVKRHGVELIDGGILNPVPIGPTLSDSTDLTIAVNLGGKPEAKHVLTNTDNNLKQNRAESEDLSPLSNQITEFFNRLIDKNDDDIEPDSNMYEVVDGAFDTMQSAIASQKLAAYPPDHLITISRNNCGILDFRSASRLIDHGYEKAQSTLGHLLLDN